MVAPHEVEQRFSVRVDGPDVVLVMTAPAARDLASSLAQRSADDPQWLGDVVQLLAAAAADRGDTAGPTARVSPPSFLRGNWSEDDGVPQPSPSKAQLETIGPHLVGVWRTKLRDGSLHLNTAPAIELADAVAASGQMSAVAAAGQSALRAALVAREAAAKSAQAAATAAAAAIALEREVGDALETPPLAAATSRSSVPGINHAQAALAAQVSAAAQYVEKKTADRHTEEISEPLRPDAASTDQS
jgi:hypothetical protein